MYHKEVATLFSAVFLLVVGTTGQAVYNQEGITTEEWVTATTPGECDGKADVVFVVDVSGSVGSTNYALAVDFIGSVVNDMNIGPNDVQIGLLLFSSSTYLEFHLNTYFNKADVLTAIQAATYYGGGTNIAGALTYLYQYMFIDVNGRRPGVPSVAVVFTDGQSNLLATQQEADTARLHDIRIVAVALGSGINEAELNAMASEPLSENRLDVASFNDLPFFKQILGRLLVCDYGEMTTTEATTTPSCNVDCEQCVDIVNGMGYMADPCSEDHFYQCTPDGTQFHMECSPCTRWSQDVVSCMRIPGCLDNATDTNEKITVHGDTCTTINGASYQTVPGDNTMYYQISYGTKTLMPCAPSTVFDVNVCGCIAGNNPPPNPSDEITCMAFAAHTLSPWGYSGSNWVWMGNSGVYEQTACSTQCDSCAVFDGQSKLEIPFFTNNYYSIQEQFTISLWYKASGTVGTGGQFLVKNGGCNNGDTLHIKLTSTNTIAALVNTTLGVYDLTNIAVSSHKWHHVVLVFDSVSQLMTLYVDMNVVGVTRVAGTLRNTPCPISVGYKYTGLMDEVCFYKEAMTYSQVYTSLYSASRCDL